MKATVHLLAGGVGAGKTTRAIALAAEHQAMRLSVDEWMGTLFLPDITADAGYRWFLERIERLEKVAIDLAVREVMFGRSVVLDFGFLGRPQRDRVRQALAEQGVQSKLHFIDVPQATRWRRVQKRNTEKGESFVVPVSRASFDFCETLLDLPGEDEVN